MKPRIKICCINSIEEAKMAINYGASAIGLVGHMPSGPGVIDDKLILEIAKSVPPPIGTFLLTSETFAKEIIVHHKFTRTNTIQIVDTLESGTYQQLREAMPAIKLVQVIHVLDEKSVDEAMEISKQVDAILLDSGNPSLQTKELGGTGRTHNWELSRKIRDSIKIPIFLAGGLNPENVKQAIDAVEPYGIDLCSGVRTNGKLDEKKLELFMNNAL
ncbi:MAG: phosphoribosylanthranilate isomerase [Calditrichia bacterium]|nr:phosphoribosylanthranilate isomerase [Calditrichia bacterium]